MNQFVKAVLPVAILMSANFAHAETSNFKRWAVSAGWLHVMPQGSANSTHINTAVVEGEKYKVGPALTGRDVMENSDLLEKYKAGEFSAIANIGIKSLITGFEKNPETLDNPLSTLMTKNAHSNVNGITQWSDKAGLEADDADTLGITLSYYANDNVSIELIGGIPPKVDVKGDGQIIASVTATSNSSGFDKDGNKLPNGSLANQAPFIDGVTFNKDLLITDLGAHGTIAEVTAWTPALTAKYHFGQSGVNKFRPFLGAGVVYGHFNKLKLNGAVEQDLVNAGYMVDNVLNGRAGEAMHGGQGSSTADVHVKVKTSDAFAPVATLGFNYDLTDRWFTTASLTYMPNFNNTATITVMDKNTGTELIKAKTKVDLDPLITYVGVGFRF